MGQPGAHRLAPGALKHLQGAGRGSALCSAALVSDPPRAEGSGFHVPLGMGALVQQRPAPVPEGDLQITSYRCHPHGVVGKMKLRMMCIQHSAQALRRVNKESVLAVEGIIKSERDEGRRAAGLLCGHPGHPGYASPSGSLPPFLGGGQRGRKLQENRDRENCCVYLPFSFD